jgi:hypothetical protein
MGFALRASWIAKLGMTALSAGLVLGCGKASDKDDDGNMMQPALGAGAAAPPVGANPPPNAPPMMGSVTPGNPANPMMPVAGSGGAPVNPVTPTAGTGSTPTDPMTPMAGSGSTPTDPMMPAAFPDCVSGPTAVGPCGTFTTDRGTKLQLGPLGAVMEANVGKGFEVAIASGDSDGGISCQLFAGGFGEDPALTEKLLDTKDLDFALYTVYRPANLVEGQKYPVLTWGNGTCAQPEGYGGLLRYVASYGYIVVAANSRWVGGNSAMTKALDWAESANKDAASPYFGHFDLDKVGAMGHSQGSSATASAASDARIKSVILFNGGTSARKTFLAISGDKDIGGYTPASMKSAVDAAPKGAFLYYHMIVGMGALAGHLTLMMQPERVSPETVAWFDYTLSASAEAGKFFLGADCKLCNRNADVEFGQKGL